MVALVSVISPSAKFATDSLKVTVTGIMVKLVGSEVVEVIVAVGFWVSTV